MRNAAYVPALAVLLSVALPGLAAPLCGGHGARETMLVSTAWLAEHLNDANLVLLAVGARNDYERGHIPGSQFLDYGSIGVNRGDPPLTLELPDVDQLTRVFSALGVSDDSRIVLYGTSNAVPPVTRAYLTLDAIGMGSRTSILDGGFRSWAAENRPVSDRLTSCKSNCGPGRLTACKAADTITSLDYVLGHMHQPDVKIVDARLEGFYTGAQIPGGRRAGHIPGAVNLAFNTLIDDTGKLQPEGKLVELFRTAGIKPGDRVVAYCHIGQQASLVYFVARYLGYDARLYDGSWEEWSRNTQLPAEVSPLKP